MIAVNTKSQSDGSAYFELSGLSTDTKPSTFQGYSVADGSLFLELDTGDFYYFSSGSWSKVGS